MDYKEFLRPDWRRILLAILIILFMPITTDYIFVDCAPCETPPCDCPGGGPVIGNLFSEIMNYASGSNYCIFCNKTHYANFSRNQMTTLFFYIIISYPISCLTIYVWDKFKVRKMVTK